MSHVEQALTELLLKIAAEQNISNPQVIIQPISSGEANYTSELFHATIADGDTELKLFAKVAAVGEKLREQSPLKIYETENTFYTKLANIYEKLQDKHNIPEHNRFISPKFYGCSDKLYEEIMVLENLSAKDFKVYDRLKSVDWEYASRAVEELAKFHALSFAFKKEEPEEFNEFVNVFKYVWKGDDNHDFWNKLTTSACNAVKKENEEKLREFFKDTKIEAFIEYYKPLRGAVLAHCDFRVSNQMYKRDADGRVQLKVVDYQTITAGSPVLDLLYFIFTGTDEIFRAQYYEKLLDHYYTELSLAMKRFGINSDEVYSREDFDHEYKMKLPFGLMVAVFTLPLVTVDVANAPKVDKDMDISSFMVDKPSDLFPERLNGIVNDFIRWGIM